MNKQIHDGISNIRINWNIHNYVVKCASLIIIIHISINTIQYIAFRPGCR